MAEFYDKKGESVSAEQLLSEIVEDAPDNIKAVCELIRIYLAKDEKKKIEDLIRDIEHRREKLQNGSVSRIADTSLLGIN